MKKILTVAAVTTAAAVAVTLVAIVLNERYIGQAKLAVMFAHEEFASITRDLSPSNSRFIIDYCLKVGDAAYGAVVSYHSSNPPKPPRSSYTVEQTIAYWSIIEELKTAGFKRFTIPIIGAAQTTKQALEVDYHTSRVCVITATYVVTTNR